jgi:hypothetical protein
MTCDRCRFFAADPPAARMLNGRGQCRAAPPAVMLAPLKTLAGDTIQPISVWPGVEATFWCGKFEEAELCNR